jgi:recombination protein RecT
MAAQQQQQRTDRQVAIVQERNRVAREISDIIEARSGNFADVLPPQISVDEFKRTLLTAISGNPDLMYADRRTLINSAVKCASDGLLPDGRRAALVVYNTKIKERDPNTGLDVERRIDAVQYLPMVFGIREQMRNSGEVESAIAEAVHRNDQFRYRLGDNAYIEHEPPPLGEDRGDVIGAYAIIKLRSGEIIRDVMDKARIEKARQQSRAKDSLMWTQFYGEGACKTVLKHASKQAPLSPKLMRLVHRDEEPMELTHGIDERREIGDQHQAEPEPTRDAGPRLVDQVETGPQFAVVDLDGVENLFSVGGRALEAMTLLLDEAAKTGLAQLEGFWETNGPTIELLAASGFGDRVEELARRFTDARAQLSAPPPAAAQTATSTGTVAASASASAQPGARLGLGVPEQGGQAPASAGQAAPAAAATADTGAATGEPAGEQQQGSADRPENLHIPPVMKQGKADWRTWAVALFLPKLRRQRDPVMLAYLLGDNEENLEQARATLGKDDLEELTRAIALQKQAAS